MSSDDRLALTDHILKDSEGSAASLIRVDGPEFAGKNRYGETNLYSPLMRMHISGIIVTALVLTACGSSADVSDSNSPTTVAVPNPSSNGTPVASEPAILKPGDKTGISLGSTRGTATLESIQTNVPCGSGSDFYQALEFTVTLDPGTSFMTAASLELTEILPDGSQATSKSNIAISDCLREDQPVLDTIRHGSTQRGWIVAKTKQDGGSLYFHTDSQNNMDSIIEF